MRPARFRRGRLPSRRLCLAITLLFTFFSLSLPLPADGQHPSTLAILKRIEREGGTIRGDSTKPTMAERIRSINGLTIRRLIDREAAFLEEFPELQNLGLGQT